MPSPLEGLRLLLVVLDDVGGRARTVKADLDATHQAASAYQTIVLPAIVAGQAAIEQAAALTISTMSNAAGAVHGSVEQMSASASRAVEAGQRAAQEVQSAAQQIQDHAATAHEVAATRLDDLAHIVQGSANLWDKAVAELIDAIKIGASDVQDLITLYGDAMVEGQTLREFLRGLDLTAYRDNVQELVRELNAGQATIEDTLKFLGQSQLGFAKQFAEIIELFRSGKLTLQAVKDAVAQIEKLFPDTEFADLAEAIENALRKGQL
jgi:hypothetical protein